MTITKEEARYIMNGIIANNKRLASCPRHEFVPTGAPPWQSDTYRCVSCGGLASHVEVDWYRQGQAHGPLADDVTNLHVKVFVADEIRPD